MGVRPRAIAWPAWRGRMGSEQVESARSLRPLPAKMRVAVHIVSVYEFGKIKNPVRLYS
jgi:hypothetical protein